MVIHMDIFTQMYIYIHIYTYTHVGLRLCMYICLRMRHMFDMLLYRCTCLYKLVHDMCMKVCIYTKCVYACTYIYTHIYACICTYRRTLVYIWPYIQCTHQYLTIVSSTRSPTTIPASSWECPSTALGTHLSPWRFVGPANLGLPNGTRSQARDPAPSFNCTTHTTPTTHCRNGNLQPPTLWGGRGRLFLFLFCFWAHPPPPM